MDVNSRAGTRDGNANGRSTGGDMCAPLAGGRGTVGLLRRILPPSLLLLGVTCFAPVPPTESRSPTRAPPPTDIQTKEPWTEPARLDRTTALSCYEPPCRAIESIAFYLALYARVGPPAAGEDGRPTAAGVWAPVPTSWRDYVQRLLENEGLGDVGIESLRVLLMDRDLVCVRVERTDHVECSIGAAVGETWDDLRLCHAREPLVNLPGGTQDPADARTQIDGRSSLLAPRAGR